MTEPQVTDGDLQNLIAGYVDRIRTIAGNDNYSIKDRLSNIRLILASIENIEAIQQHRVDEINMRILEAQETKYAVEDIFAT